MQETSITPPSSRRAPSRPHQCLHALQRTQTHKRERPSYAQRAHAVQNCPNTRPTDCALAQSLELAPQSFAYSASTCHARECVTHSSSAPIHRAIRRRGFQEARRRRPKITHAVCACLLLAAGAARSLPQHRLCEEACDPFAASRRCDPAQR